MVKREINFITPEVFSFAPSVTLSKVSLSSSLGTQLGTSAFVLSDPEYMNTKRGAAPLCLCEFMVMRSIDAISPVIKWESSI